MKDEKKETPWALLMLFYIVGCISTGAEALASFWTTWFHFVDMFGIRWQWQYLYYYTFVFFLRLGWCSWGIDKQLVSLIGSSLNLDASAFDTYSNSDKQKEVCKTGFDMAWEDMWYDSEDINTRKFFTSWDVFNYTPNP